MDIQLRSLRIFIRVCETGSFSSAARALKTTQPTVSQQIAKLESELGGRLFERVGHEIHVTDLGRTFQSYALEMVERTDRLNDDLNNERTQHVGLVRYAMPESCQWTPHFRAIMSDLKKLPDLRFEIAIAPSEEVLRLILEGKSDFGFAVGERLHPELRFEHFADEAYAAVAANDALLRPLKEKDFQSVRWIAFPGWELFFDAWAKAHGLARVARAHLTHPKVHIGTLAGAIHAAQEGAGIAVIPAHCVAQELDKGKLREYALAKKRATNPIHIVKRGLERLPARSEKVLQMLRLAKKTLG